MSFSRTSLGNLDLNLLFVLIVLVDECSTVRAARRLRLAQSTISGTLGRLRKIFGDELLVRNGRTLEPTARALELVRVTKPHIEALSTAVGAKMEFEPARSHREFRIGCTDGVAISMLPDLTRVLREAAPNCNLVVRIGDYQTLPDMLASGEISTALGYLRNSPPAKAKVKVLRTSSWVVLHDINQLPVRDVDDFCSRPQAIISPLGDLTGFVDDQLNELGRTRRVVISLSSFSLLLATIPNSDLITTIPDFIAEKLACFCNLKITPCPVRVPLVKNTMAWSTVIDNDPAEQWFRSQVLKVFATGRSKSTPPSMK
ncbi:MAG TPA: LysR family transcriptional regulator [Rhodospirillales bacterium]|nr:LysR family transcriptional regulator [Rhodospirillales bacterium]